MKKKLRKKADKIRRMELPSNTIDMERFVIHHRDELMDIIVDNIEHAMDNKLPNAEPFSFEGGPYVVIINQLNFKENLDNIFAFSLKAERFERCAKIQKLLDRLPKPRFSKHLKNINLLPYGKKDPSE